MARPSGKGATRPGKAPGGKGKASVNWWQRLLSLLTGGKSKSKAKGKVGAPGRGKQAASRPRPRPAEGGEGPLAMPAPLDGAPANEPAAGFFEQFATVGEAGAAPGREFQVIFGLTMDAMDQARVEELVVEATRASRRLEHAYRLKQGQFAGYLTELLRANEAGDYLGMCFVGSSLYVAASFAGVELQSLAQNFNASASILLGQLPERKPSLENRFLEAREAWHVAAAKVNRSLEPLVADLVTAHDQRDLSRVADLAIALSRNALILSAFTTDLDAEPGPPSTELTALAVGERTVPLGHHVERLRQAVEAGAYEAVADLARVVSLQASTRTDSLVVRALGFESQAEQLFDALVEEGDESERSDLADLLLRLSRSFHTPLRQRADQLADQVKQLQAALEGAQQDRMFSMAVALTRTSAILTDGAIRLVSRLSDVMPTLHAQIKKGELAAARAALKEAFERGGTPAEPAPPEAS